MAMPVKLHCAPKELPKTDLLPSSHLLILTKIQMFASLESYLCSAATLHSESLFLFNILTV